MNMFVIPCYCMSDKQEDSVALGHSNKKSKIKTCVRTGKVWTSARKKPRYDKEYFSI